VAFFKDVFMSATELALPVSETAVRVEHRGNGFYHQDILSVRQFDREKLNYVFGSSEQMRRIVEVYGSCDLLKGKVLANLFYEPSTRTSCSFEAAMKRLGGEVVQINEVRYSSVAKGENLEDTVRTLASYTDIIALRHPQEGSAARAAIFCDKPIINAGDGIGEHPTQALLDLYTIQNELKTIDGLKVVMVGDLANGRTVHSLSVLLSLYDVQFQFVSPPFLRLPNKYKDELSRRGRSYRQHEQLKEVIDEADVLYVTRIQKERFEEQNLTAEQYEEARGAYLVDPALLVRAKEKMIVMHPLPRVGEISGAVDQDPRAAYFRQMKNGMYVRMALLAAVLGKAQPS
jgi:aspartate carbamoyltransferase